MAAARAFDQADELAAFRTESTFPTNIEGEPLLYFAGHSLGLMPNRAREALNAECDAWGKYAVKGHFESERPWVRCHTYVADSLARLSGAKPSEVVAMNTLTVNLHLMLVSFYRPTKTRYKIIIEKNAFPSDQYAVDSQARFHGFYPDDAIVELEPKPGQPAIADDDVLELFDAATMPRVRAKSEQLTSYLEWLLLENVSDFVEVLTPPHTLAKQTRGCTLSLRFKKDPRGMLKVLSDRGAVTDFREPDIIRVAPIPLYNSFEDVYRFSEIVAEFCSNG